MTGAEPGGAVLTEQGPAGSSARVGLRLEPDPLAHRSGAHGGVPEDQRRTETAAREGAWIAEQWAPGHRVEVRCTLHEPGPHALLTCTLLGSVVRRDPDTARADARSLLSRLGDTPRHVRAEPLTDPEAIRRELRPFEPRRLPDGGLGVVEVRKALHWSPWMRTDARFPLGFAVAPLRDAPGASSAPGAALAAGAAFASGAAVAPGVPAGPGGGAVSWEPVWDELRRLPGPALLSVCLEPFAVTEGFRARMALLAQEYTRLAAPGTPSPVYQVPLHPDPFAARTAPLHHDALRRYQDRAYRLRITLAARDAVPVRAAELLAAALGGVVRRPPPYEADAAWRAVTAVERPFLPETHGQGASPQGLGEMGVLLSDLVDRAEATAAFRFPYEVPGRPALFRTAGRTDAHAGPVPGPRPGTGAGSPGDPSLDEFSAPGFPPPGPPPTGMPTGEGV
ncbi:hypothetical protein [Streptomyces sp. Ru87]|uniref:hypothetical protein n=1 Tax=Streptomyces sp. Ru87 TaxID=2044307 RepID=UPI000BF95475|nr:hypothetical protein [Streptomyces sp. Ru87]PGH48710.1 hypothetical protein CRI70_21540 [Streptomyces sp. Ru87]